MGNKACRSMLDTKMKPQDLAEQIINMLVDRQEPQDDQCFFVGLQIVEARMVFVSCTDGVASQKDVDYGSDEDAFQLILGALESG